MSIIIAGGGMAGATLALAISRLSQGALPVTLIETRAPGSVLHPGYDSRAIALASGTCQQLDAIGLWSSLRDYATPIAHVHVSDRGHMGLVSLDAQDYALSALGHVIELKEAGHRLFMQLRQAKGVTLRCPSTVTNVVRSQQQVMVTLQDGEQLAGELLVAANGTGSHLAAACGIRWRTEAYQQLAVTANVSTQLPHQHRAFERFTSTGPLALLPMTQGRCSLVWCHSLAEKTQVDSWSDSLFLSRLQHTFGWRLGKFTQLGQRESYPLVLQTALQTTHHRLVLVGNAAQTLHPIAGQGFNLALRDVMTLAETLVGAYRQQQDTGSIAVLHRYRQRRQSDRQTTTALTDGLTRLFASHYTPLVMARNLGLMAMDNLSLIRHLLAGRALGWVKR